jgi:hypothetical protein
MNKKLFWLSGIGCALVLLFCTFSFWPVLGHDYALIVPSLIDLKVAWSQHGVFNPEYSPMKCLGSPLWSNPVSFNLSILHFLTLLSNDVIGMGLFIVIVSLMSFWGAYRLSIRMSVSERYALYLAAGWTLQGWMIMRTTVGHLTYLSLGWFPLIIYLLLKQKTLVKDMLGSALAGYLLSQYIFLAAPYVPFFLVVSLLCLLPLLFIFKRSAIVDWKIFVPKSLVAGLIAFLLVWPKYAAVKDLMANFPRSQAMMKVGVSALPYSIMNVFSFLPHDYKFLVEWWYGNWESVQFVFPLFFLSALFFLFRKKDEKTFLKFFGSLLGLILVSFIFTSGILSDVFQKVPLLQSLHVNPRWNIVIALPLFFLAAVILSDEELFPKNWTYVLFFLVFLVPFLHLRPANLNINYVYRGGYSPEVNRLSYCYEPFLGYRLEFFPYPADQVNFTTSPRLDPRCYLSSHQCSPGTLLSPEDIQLLEVYKLR